MWIYQVGVPTLADVARVVVNKPKPLDEKLAEERDRLQVAFGKQLRELRTERGLTLEMLAERADLHENYVGSVERGERNISLYNIWRLAHALGYEAGALLGHLPKRKPHKSTDKAW